MFNGYGYGILVVLVDLRVGPMMVEPYAVEMIANVRQEIHKQVQE